MTQFKGSKTDWKSVFTSDKKRAIRDEGGLICILTQPSKYSGQNERYDKELEEVRANQKLIECALPMLELLENIVEYWNGDRNDKAMFDALNHIIFESEEMIKKATTL